MMNNKKNCSDYRAETNTQNQYSNIRDCYSIRIRIFVDVMCNVLCMFVTLNDRINLCVGYVNTSVRCWYM